MGWLENVIIENREIEGERLELTDKRSLYFLGRHLTLRGCTLVLKVPARNLHIVGARFIDCTFEVKQELKNHQAWVAASLKGCRFKGNLSGCDFGHWPDYGSGPEYQLGSIEDCDFSEARLDGCRILGSDPASLRFPSWPCFTLLEPLTRLPELRAAPWPELFARDVIDELHTRPPSMRAVTYFAPALARRYETTVDALRAAVETLGGLVR